MNIDIALPKIIAHRGGYAELPENTLMAFHQAKHFGAEMIEFDVRLTCDYIPVVIHDDVVDNTINGKFKVAELTLAEIKKFDVGQGETVPTLVETLECLSKLQLGANLEIKSLPHCERKTTTQIMNIVSAYQKKLPALLISSFQYSMLKCIRKNFPQIAIASLFHDVSQENLQQIKDLRCCAVGLDNNYLDYSQAKLIKIQNYKLLCYTVNETTRASQLFSWGVDAIFTDRVDLMNNFLFREKKNHESEKYH